VIARWKKISRDLEEELGRIPNTKELAKAMQLTPKKVRIIRKAVRAFQRPAQSGGDDEDGVDLIEMLSDDRTVQPDDQVLQKDDMETILALLDIIDEREATILRLRFGLNGEGPLTLKEVGDRVGLTRERVRQIEIEALRKLNERLNSEDPFDARHEKPRRRRRGGRRRRSEDEPNSGADAAEKDESVQSPRSKVQSREHF